MEYKQRKQTYGQCARDPTRHIKAPAGTKPAEDAPPLHTYRVENTMLHLQPVRRIPVSATLRELRATQPNKFATHCASRPLPFYVCSAALHGEQTGSHELERQSPRPRHRKTLGPGHAMQDIQHILHYYPVSATSATIARLTQVNSQRPVFQDCCPVVYCLALHEELGGMIEFQFQSQRPPLHKNFPHTVRGAHPEST